MIEVEIPRSQKVGKKAEVSQHVFKNILEKEITLFPHRFSDKVKEAFYLELGTLLSAGLDIKSALDLLESEQEKPKNAAVISLLRENLIGGKSLWEAMHEAGHFTPYEYYAVQIGEETGKLVPVLNQLYQYFSAKLKQRRQLVSALSYPVIILLTSIGAVCFMLLFIVPMFEDVFKRFGGELPGLTKIIIDISTGLQANFGWFIIIILAGITFLYTKRSTHVMKKWTARLVNRIPVVGKIVYSLHMARFCTSMALLLGSRVPMIRALKLVGQMITYYPLQQTFASVESDILKGESLHTSLARFSVYNRKMISLVKVGEEVNKLDVFFDKLATQYSSDAEHQTSLLNTFLEPAMIIFLGAVVGFILLAMYLPMFQMSTHIGG